MKSFKTRPINQFFKLSEPFPFSEVGPPQFHSAPASFRHANSKFSLKGQKASQRIQNRALLQLTMKQLAPCPISFQLQSEYKIALPSFGQPEWALPAKQQRTYTDTRPSTHTTRNENQTSGPEGLSPAPTLSTPVEPTRKPGYNTPVGMGQTTGPLSTFCGCRLNTWVFRLLWSFVEQGQKEQLYGVSPVCFQTCFFTLNFLYEVYGQNGHLWRLASLAGSENFGAKREAAGENECSAVLDWFSVLPLRGRGREAPCRCKRKIQTLRRVESIWG